MPERTGKRTGADPSIDTLSIEDLAGELVSRGEEAFRFRHSCPFLVVCYSPPDDSEEVELQTVETQLSDLPGEKQRKPIIKVVPLVKTKRNAFSTKITVGRAKNNDVILRASKVSKVHAAFMVGKDKWQLVDMGSVNGTLLNGKRLQKNQAVDLKSGDMIAFWRYVFEYHDTDSFVAILHKFSKHGVKRSPPAVE